MADYKGIKGGKVQNFSTNPPAPIPGQVWYNETTFSLNYFSSNPAGSWATGGVINTARAKIAGSGTQTSALATAGRNPPSFSNTAVNESYNGTAWTEVADLNSAKTSGGAAGADNTAALYYGGYVPDNSKEAESWNGTAWTEVGDMNTARGDFGSNGQNNTNAMACGGYTTTAVAITETWNGTAWTEVADLNTARNSATSTGPVSAAIAIGGSSPDCETWNGTSWAEVNNVNTSRSDSGSAGDSSEAIKFGGGNPRIANTEDWNGTAWTEVADLSTARSQLGKAGSYTAALAFGGETPPVTTATEEWNAPTESTKTVDTD